MAYANGAAANIDDILEAIENFAIAEGWTIGKRATNLLFLEKGLCHLALQQQTYNYNDYSSGALVSTPGGRIAGALSTSLNNTLSNFFSHPGSLATSATDADHVATTQLLNGCAEYHLFSGDTGAGDPDYIHCVFRINATDWKQLSFGMIDKGGFTHSGAAFLVGNAGLHYANSTSITSSSQAFNQPSRNYHPYYNNGDKMYGAGCNLYVPDALPNVATWPNGISSNSYVNLMDVYDRGPDSYPSSSSAPTERFCQPLLTSPAAMWGGNVMLFGLPLFCYNTTLRRTCYVGDFPNVRGVNMSGLTPGQELTLGGETWMVCPTGRQRAWGTASETGLNYSTGQLGLAYKKIV